MNFVKQVFAYLYYIFHKFITKNRYKMEMGRWFFLQGNERFAYSHNLNESSVVFEVGGYTGVFTDRMIEKYNPFIFVFEPVLSFYNILVEKYKNNLKVKVFQYGLSDETRDEFIKLIEDKSSVLIDEDESNEVEKVQLVNIQEFMENHKNIMNVDLININIEGGEYGLLNKIISSGLILKFNIIQVQFHNFFKDATPLRRGIKRKLSDTHKVKYSFPFVWECFVRRDDK